MTALDARRASGMASVLALLSAVIGCGPSNHARSSDQASESHATSAPALAITRFEQLAAADGQLVTVVGIYRLHDPVPQLRRDPPNQLSAILLEGDARPQLFLQPPRSEDEQRGLADQRVRVTGVFHRTQPQQPGDPPHAVTYSGSWIYDITLLEPVR